MANFFESLGRTQAIPQAMNSLSNMAVQMRQMKIRDERNEREKTISKVKMDEINKQQAAEDTPLPLSTLRGQMAIQSPQVFEAGVQDLKQAGLIKQMDASGGSDIGNLYIRKGDGKQALEILRGNAPKYIELWNQSAKAEVAEAQAKYDEVRAKKSLEKETPGKPAKKPPELIALEEAQEGLRLSIMSREEIDKAFNASQEQKRTQAEQTQKREFEQRKLEEGREYQKGQASQEQEREAEQEQKTIITLKNAIIKIDPSQKGKLPDDSKSLRTKLAEVGKKKGGEAITPAGKRSWHKDVRVILKELIPEGEEGDKVIKKALSKIEKYREQGENITDGALSALKDAKKELELEKTFTEPSWWSSVWGKIFGDDNAGQKTAAPSVSSASPNVTPENIRFTAEKHGVSVDEVKRRLGIR